MAGDLKLGPHQPLCLLWHSCGLDFVAIFGLPASCMLRAKEKVRGCQRNPVKLGPDLDQHLIPTINKEGNSFFSFAPCKWYSEVCL